MKIQTHGSWTGELKRFELIDGQEVLTRHYTEERKEGLNIDYTGFDTFPNILEISLKSGTFNVETEGDCLIRVMRE